MASDPTEALARSVVRTLEEAAFVFAGLAESSPPPFSGTVLEARLAFWGGEAGELTIATDNRLAAELAANLLGEDAEDPEVANRGHEALGELVNMVAGALVVDLYGERSVCRLGVPAIRTVDAARYRRENQVAPGSVVLITEEGRRLDVSLLPAAGG